MATERLSMRKTREILRLCWSLGRTARQAAASVGVSPGSVGKTIKRAKNAGLDWAAVELLDDPALELRLYPPTPTKTSPPHEPDPAFIHRELKRPAVTLEVLHLEYLLNHPDGLQYTAFCDRYRAFKKKLGITMRQDHKAGDKMFIDFSGRRPVIVDPKTGEIKELELFVAVLGASCFTYAEATASQRLPDWVSAHSNAVEYFGGSAQIWVPDRLKSAVTGHDRDDPTIQRTYREQAHHYGAIVIPARPYKARDKAKVEVTVQIAQRWILARLRHETFFSIEALNERIWELLDELNARPRKKLGGVSRKDLFERIEKDLLKPLPETRFDHHDWKRVKVNLDYHVEVDRHWYSVPHILVREEVEACFSSTVVEVFHRGKRIASHARSYAKYGHTTDPQHRPANHQAWADKDPGGLEKWATAVGPSTAAMMKRILESNPHRDQTWRSGRALRRVGDKYGAVRTEVACERALRFGARSYKPIERMLKTELDLRPHPDDADVGAAPIQHDQIRGPDYYLN